MVRGLFITGTDTGVGKTVVSAALVLRYPELRYWKPIQTGIENDDDTAVIRRLSGGAAGAVRNGDVRLPGALSPHLAAQRAGTRIDLDRLTEWTGSDPGERHWLVEGAGGVLVPLNESHTMAHLMVRLALPVIVVARSGIGTINHSLLTLEALRVRSLTVAGVVLVGDRNPDNRAAIERYGHVTVIGEMPKFDPLTADRLGRWARSELDTAGHLKEYLA
jgi:dethiobiotin synthase